MKHPAITVGITTHNEPDKWIERCVKAALAQPDAPGFEVIITRDRPTRLLPQSVRDRESDTFRIIDVDHGDLGASRNTITENARGKYVAYCDADDIFGYMWLKQAYWYAEVMTNKRFFLHPEINMFFGRDSFMHKHIGDDSPQFDAKGLCQFNEWSALAFAPRTVLEEFPYMKVGKGLSWEDWCANVRTFGAGVSHRVVPASIHMLRLKGDNSSLAARSNEARGVIPRMELFDRRDLPDATAPPPEKSGISDDQVKQIIFAHREIGERQVMLDPSMTIRQYPRQRCWNDQAFLRDAIGDAKHVVLVNELVRGGAEKYGIDWAAALTKAGEKVCLVETTPGTSVWLKKATEKGVSVVQWKQQADLTPDEQLYALQRALIQCELKSLLVCNSNLGWGLVHSNAECLAEKVFAASFATIPAGFGFEMCPPFFMKDLAPNLTFVTDNEAQADKIRDFNGARVVVIRPKCDYEGPSKRSQIDKKHIRVLWAGRGTPEKNPEILPALAKGLEDVADIHVWGDVKPMNGPENLKYRGPFDGFASIDGSYNVYLLTSINEGMPNTAMEAVLAGLPVVGPSVGGLPEIAFSTFTTLDIKTIAGAIKEAAKVGGDKAEIIGEGPAATVRGWRDAYSYKVACLVAGIPEEPTGIIVDAETYEQRGPSHQEIAAQ